MRFLAIMLATALGSALGVSAERIYRYVQMRHRQAEWNRRKADARRQHEAFARRLLGA